MRVLCEFESLPLIWEIIYIIAAATLAVKSIYKYPNQISKPNCILKKKYRITKSWTRKSKNLLD